MTRRRRLGLVATAGFGAVIAVAPAIAAVTSQGDRGAPAGGFAAPLAISLEPGDNTRVSMNVDGSQFVRIDSDQAAVSPDGRWVTYRAALVGVSSTSRADAVLLADRPAGTTTRIFPTTVGPSFSMVEGPVGPVAPANPGGPCGPWAMLGAQVTSPTPGTYVESADISC
jgi:hypothetical protein